jgi:thiamine biosynthesis lipoprotein
MMKTLLVFFIATAVFILSCTQQKEKLYRKSSIIMDTLVNITVVSDSEEKAENAIDQAFEEIRKLEKLLNFWTEDSDIAAINKNAGIKPVKVSPETIDIIEKALFISEKTRGAFDPTIGPVIRLWDFRKKTKPDESTLNKILDFVDYKEIEMDKEKHTVFLKKKGMSFDTGGIAKGYAADKAVSVLKSAGIKAGLVAVAGDIKAFGLKPDGTPWRIGIRNPRAKSKKDDIMAVIGLEDEAISTSGDYERFFIEDGVRYHHLLNPKTGYPAQGCQSVSIITKDAVFTDGFSTGIFVLGPEEGIKVLEELGFEGIIVDKDGRIIVTDGIKKRIQWKVNPIE